MCGAKELLRRGIKAEEWADYEAAITLYRTIVHRYPDTPQAEQAEKSIERLEWRQADGTKEAATVRRGYSPPKFPSQHFRQPFLSFYILAMCVVVYLGLGRRQSDESSKPC
jgi:hypothetical protein